MKLKNIINNLNIVKIENFKNINITNITHISKDIDKNGMFICIDGNNYSGNDYVFEVIENGCKCIVTEKTNLNYDCVIIVVKDIRIAMSIIAKNFYNKCCDYMDIIGVVGTAGKTTTSIMLSQMLSQNGESVGVIGTNGIFIGNIKLENKFTTPDPLELHYIFYRMKLLGVKKVIMEVSAQAIYYNKVYGIYFKTCIFTNISKEHLDFFGTMENYVKCKMDFFNKLNMKQCIVNIDDFYGMELAYKVDIPCISYGINNPANSFALDIKLNINSSSFTANILDDILEIKTPFVGMFNVYNLIASLTAIKLLDKNISLKKCVKNLKLIDGRFNIFYKNNTMIIIDFAHTPYSIEKLLATIKEFSNRKIISVFGCVGYSDKQKRIDIAKSISKFSDYAIITTDNRGKVPFMDISNDIKSGLSISFKEIEDRSNAIKYALDIAKEDDVVVIIGKGAEEIQLIDDVRVKYSDIEYVKKLINNIE